jgi:hypothetical protein
MFDHGAALKLLVRIRMGGHEDLKHPDFLAHPLWRERNLCNQSSLGDAEILTPDHNSCCLALNPLGYHISYSLSYHIS